MSGEKEYKNPDIKKLDIHLMDFGEHMQRFYNENVNDNETKIALDELTHQAFFMFDSIIEYLNKN